jgi:hypothetical protein
MLWPQSKLSSNYNSIQTAEIAHKQHYWTKEAEAYPEGSVVEMHLSMKFAG